MSFEIYDHVMSVSFSFTTKSEAPTDEASELPYILAAMQMRHDRIKLEASTREDKLAIANESFEDCDNTISVDPYGDTDGYYLKQHEVMDITREYISPEILLHCANSIRFVEDQLKELKGHLQSTLQLLYSQSEGNKELRQSIADLANSLTPKAVEAGSIEKELRAKLDTTRKFLE